MTGLDADMVARGKAAGESGRYKPAPVPADALCADEATLDEPPDDGYVPPDEPPPNDGRRNGNGKRAATLLSGLMSAADLDKMTFPPLVEHVPNLITEGFGILAGPPKAGKSWFVGGVALGCAYGGTVLAGAHAGITVAARHVLLLALEDGPRRLQSRMRRLNHDRALPPRLDILTEVAPGTVTAVITEWLGRHRADTNPPLVILDTLGRARPQRRASDDPYIADYQLGSKIKATIDAVPGAALVAVHHTRKMGAEDWLDAVSGTQGIAGSADYILVLRRKRKSDDGVLHVTGRDIAENDYALTVDNGIWSLDGMDILDAAATIASRAEESQQTRLGNRSLDAMKFVNSRATTSPKDLAEHLKIDNQEAGRQLKRLHDGGYIAKHQRGEYRPVDGKSGESSKTADQPPQGVLPHWPYLPPTTVTTPCPPERIAGASTGEDGTEGDTPPSGTTDTAPPGAPTDRTPGMTDRVKLALANATSAAIPRCACGAELTSPESVAGRCRDCVFIDRQQAGAERVAGL